MALTTETTKYWAIAELYEPFRMGGPLWNWYCYKITDAEEHVVAGIRVFVYFDEHAQRFRAHEFESGGWLGENRNPVVVGGAANEAAKARALAVAKRNIERTPDIKKQIDELGPATYLPSYDADEILRRLAKKKGCRNA